MEPRNVLYFAENALSTIQGGGIVAYAVLKGLPPERLLGFYVYRNITPAPEYADRFVYLGGMRTPRLIDRVNRLSRQKAADALHRLFVDAYSREDMEFVRDQVAKAGFTPEIVYFSGLSYRTLRLAVLAAEHYDVPMAVLHMDDWIEVERLAVRPRWRERWHRRTVREMKRAAARSLVSTSNSPRLAAKLTEMTGYRHAAANNCCSDLMGHATAPSPSGPNPVPVITYAGSMNHELQGETLRILASAVAELNAEGTPVHLHIYTPWEFAPYANSIAMPNAVFYKGQVPREALTDVYRQADFLVTTVTCREHNIPYFRHSLSTKLSEYLCVGKPVISMGHFDWHMHEYVQDHGCGFSILMDENFSLAKIKQQLRRILSTDAAVLARIGARNRELWERGHDVTVMARATRRVVGLESAPVARVRREHERRGVVWVGEAGPAPTWVPAPKVNAICRQLVDTFELDAVDVMGTRPVEHPALAEVVRYCRDIGLAVTVTDAASADETSWDPAAAHWALAAEQRSPSSPLTTPRDVFQQVSALRPPRAMTERSAAIDGAINQLTVRVSESPARLTQVWLYGSSAVGVELTQAIQQHVWLRDALEIAGFISSPGHCKGETLHGYRWRPVDAVQNEIVDIVVVTSDTSRLAIQEELNRAGLLDRAVLMYGMAATAPECSYERIPGDPGQAYAAGLTARDYATRELRVRLAVASRADATDSHVTDTACARVA